MKKFLALALVALMLAALALPMSAKANETVEALYFDEAPKIDGVIEEDVWGEPTVVSKAGQATTYQMGTDAVVLEMNIWLRWDKDNFYIGVTSPDKDGQSLQAGEGSNWNGDVIQWRLDPFGPISSGDATAPFSGKDVTNVSFGYLTNEKKNSVYDHSKFADCDKIKAVFGEKNGVFTWEIAMPHAQACSGAGAAGLEKNIKEGFVYGLSLVRLNAPTGGTYNAWLTWGDGVCGPQDNDLRCGSNGVKLSEEPAVVIEVVEEETEAAAAAKDAPKATTAAKTSDASVVMFAALAMISLAGAAVVSKKVR